MILLYCKQSLKKTVLDSGIPREQSVFTKQLDASNVFRSELQSSGFGQSEHLRVIFS